MRLLFFFIILLIGCQKSNIKSDLNESLKSKTDTTSYVPHASSKADCGMSPYLLMGDQMFADENSRYKVSVRFVKIVKEKEPESINLKRIKKSIDRLNQDFGQVRLSFSADEVVIIEDPIAYKEGISMYQKHGRIYSQRGYLNIFIYDSDLTGGFAGAAGGIPSRFVAIKSFYLSTSTISHEVAHALLGLYHIFQVDDSGVKNTYETGDLVCGTPYADFFSTYVNQGYLGRVTDDCEYIGPLGNLTQEEHNANIRNIMSYSLDVCRTEITKGQKERAFFIINQSENLKEMIEITH